jgi:hypothetical protein
VLVGPFCVTESQKGHSVPTKAWLRQKKEGSGLSNALIFSAYFSVSQRLRL